MSARPMTLLLVDADPARRAARADALAAAGYEPTPCAGRGEALEALRNRPRDLALVDESSPDTAALEVTAALLARDPDARALLLVAPEAARGNLRFERGRVKLLPRGAGERAILDYLALQAEGVFRDRRRRTESSRPFAPARRAFAALAGALRRSFVLPALAVSLVVSLAVVSAGNLFVVSSAPPASEASLLRADDLFDLYQEVRSTLEHWKARDLRGR